MSLIVVKAKKCVMEESVVALGIPPKGEEDFSWLDTCIRSEDIAEFHKRSEAKIILSFYDERSPMIIKESFEDLMAKINNADYNISSYQEESI